MGPPDSFSPPPAHTAALSFDNHSLSLFAFSFQVRSVAQQSRADGNKRHFSRSALICSIPPRAWCTSLPAHRYSFQRRAATKRSGLSYSRNTANRTKIL
jgi:hypothetical protein